MSIFSVTNNPGNIRVSNNRWLGSCGSYKGFVKFRSVEFGVRALLCLLRTYRKKYHLLTIRDIISRFAPSYENMTWSYIAYVSEMLRKRSCDFLSDEDMPVLALYIMRFEIGSNVCDSCHLDLVTILSVMEKYHISYGVNRTSLV